jgi:hypothetical protein
MNSAEINKLLRAELLRVTSERDMYASALIHIKTMDCYTREGEEPAHMIMKRIAEEVLPKHPDVLPEDLKL